jgi:hypothetical protein
MERARERERKQRSRAQRPRAKTEVWIGIHTNRESKDEPQRIVGRSLLSRLQYLDNIKSSAKDLLLPALEMEIRSRML